MTNTNRVITLLTDFGLQDTYVSAMKGMMLKINPEVKIIDLTHLISPQDIKGASYALYSSYRFFPKGTIHIAVVDPEVGSSRRIICAKVAHQYFLAPDNGLLTLVLKAESLHQIFEIDLKKLPPFDISFTFHGRDIFAPVAAYLSIGRAIESFARKIEKPISTLNIFSKVTKGGLLKGEIIHIDGFGNLITNIERKTFVEACKGKKPMVCIRGHSIQGFSRFYNEARKGELLALWNSSDFLEVSINQGSAMEALRAKQGDTVTVMKAV